MKTVRKLVLLAVVFAGSTAGVHAEIVDNVSAFGTSAFLFTSAPGVQNPTLTLYRGVTYLFNNADAFGHPMYLKTNLQPSILGQYTNGVTGNGTTLVRFVVPGSAPNQLNYFCANHGSLGMRGLLNISNVPAPPSGQVVLVTLTPGGVTMKSIGLSTWKPIPEFKSNLMSGSWTVVPNFTNTFAGGTNTTMFDRLEPICGPDVFLRIRNQFP